MGQLGPFRASEDILAQKMVTLSATIALLQMMSILPTMGLCRTCKVPTPKWKEENWIFWECGSCPSSLLARKIYKEQKKNNWPGLIKETKEICKALGIEDVNETMQNAKDYRNLVKIALKAKDKSINEELAKDKEKCKKIMKEGYGKKEYFANKKIKDVREIFQTRTGMLPFAGNYSKDKRFSKTDWRCSRPHICHFFSTEKIFG